MRAAAPDNLAAIADWLQRSDRAAHLLLDYDGTLAPFRVERSEARPYPAILPLLERVVRAGRTRVSIVSGRPADEVRGLLHPLRGLEIWGAHGLERISAEGEYERAGVVPKARAILIQAEDWLREAELLSLAEIKPGGIAVHWRGRSAAEADAIARRIQSQWSGFAEERSMKLLAFDGGVELRAAHPDKGDVVDAILKRTAAGAAVAFLGDDLTDEDGFRALGARGLSVLVRQQWRATAAQVWLRPPRELEEFLKMCAERFA
jgi:trehalose-phosphatase